MANVKLSQITALGGNPASGDYIVSTTSSNTVDSLVTYAEALATMGGIANSWTAAQTYSSDDLRILGSSTGYTQFTTANAGATNYTVTYQAATGTVALLTLADQTVTGGANVTSDNLGTQSSGTLTIDCGKCPLQYLTNNGAFTLAAPSNDGSCMVFVTNGSSAGTITFSGFTVGSNTGDALNTTNTDLFTISIWRINGTSGYRIAAHQ